MENSASVRVEHVQGHVRRARVARQTRLPSVSVGFYSRCIYLALFLSNSFSCSYFTYILSFIIKASGATRESCLWWKWICDGEFLQSPLLAKFYLHALKKLIGIYFPLIFDNNREKLNSELLDRCFKREQTIYE